MSLVAVLKNAVGVERKGELSDKSHIIFLAVINSIRHRSHRQNLLHHVTESNSSLPFLEHL